MGIDSVGYADDITVLADNIGQLYEAMRIIEKFCATSGMKLNKKKCKILPPNKISFIGRKEIKGYPIVSEV